MSAISKRYSTVTSVLSNGKFNVYLLPWRMEINGLRSPEGEVSLDFKGKKPGRGAYVCPDPECLKKARKSRALERAFSAALPPEVYEALEGQMKTGEEQDG